jgi:hypothetical protein
VAWKFLGHPSLCGRLLDHEIILDIDTADHTLSRRAGLSDYAPNTTHFFVLTMGRGS